MNTDVYLEILLYVEIKELPGLRLLNREFNSILNSSYYWKSRFSRDNLPLMKERDEFVTWYLEYLLVEEASLNSSLERLKADKCTYLTKNVVNIRNIEIFFVDSIDRVWLQRQYLKSMFEWRSHQIRLERTGDYYFRYIIKGTCVYETILTIDAFQKIMFYMNYYGARYMMCV